MSSVSSSHQEARRGGMGSGERVGGRLANKVSTINGVGECKAFIFAIVISYCLQNTNKRICHADRRDVYTPGLANLNASRPSWRHRGGLAEERLVRSVVRITVGHPK